MTGGLRVGIVGTGWGSLVHAPAFTIADGYDLTAICARDPGRLAKAAAAAGIDDTATDWRSFEEGWSRIPSTSGSSYPKRRRLQERSCLQGRR